MERPSGPRQKPERLRSQGRAGDEGRIGERCQFNEPDPVREVIQKRTDRLQGKPCLADSTRAGQGEKLEGYPALPSAEHRTDQHPALILRDTQYSHQRIDRRRAHRGVEEREPPRQVLLDRQVQDGERAFLEDYPYLDFAGLSPAWGPECDLRQEQLAFAQERRFGLRKFTLRGMRTLRRWRSYGLGGILSRSTSWVDRWWRLH